MRPVDVLIVGQGIAGSALAWRLAEAGADFLVVDRGGVDDAGRPSASRIAAGLITPIIGKRLTITPEWETARDTAVAFYRWVEGKTGAAMLDERPSVRVLRSAEERALYERRRSDERFARHAEPLAAGDLPAAIGAEHDAFAMRAAARLDAGAFLGATRRWLTARDAYRKAEIDPRADLDLSADRVRVPRLGVSCRRVAFCQGWSPATAASVVPALAPDKGELLHVEAPGLRLDRVTHRGVWLAPTGKEERYILGATHEWEQIDSVPTAAARRELLAALATFCGFEVIIRSHLAGVRPATANRRPLAGVAPTETRLAWLNGLGTRGVLWAPWYASRLAPVLLRHEPPGGVDLHNRVE